MLDALQIAIIGYVFTTVLMDQEQIFGFWWRFLDHIYRYYHWGWIIAKPLGHCERCFTGQLALWTYIFTFGLNIGIIFHVCLSLFILVIIQKIL